MFRNVTEKKGHYLLQGEKQLNNQYKTLVVRNQDVAKNTFGEISCANMTLWVKLLVEIAHWPITICLRVFYSNSSVDVQFTILSILQTRSNKVTAAKAELFREAFFSLI